MSSKDASAERAIRESVVCMSTLRNLWDTDGLAPRTWQAALMIAGCKAKCAIRYADGNGFDYRLQTGRYKKASLLEYARQLIVDGANPGDSVWGSDIAERPTVEEREHLFRRKVHEVVSQCELFAGTYAAFRASLPDAEWAHALEEFMGGEDVIVRRVPAKSPNRRSAPAPTASSPAKPLLATPASSPAKPLLATPASSPAKSRPAKRARRDSTSSEDSGKDADFLAGEDSSSSSSDEGGGASSDDDVPLDRLALRGAPAEAEPEAEPAAAPHAWLDAILARVQACGEDRSARLQQFCDRFLPKSSDGLRKAALRETPARKIAAERSTCERADAILSARRRRLDAVEAFLHPDNLAREFVKPLRPVQLEILRESLALIDSKETNARVIIGSGVGTGKTFTTLVALRMCFMGVLGSIQIPGAMVIAPGHLIREWERECRESLRRAQVVKIDHDSLNLESLTAAYLRFYTLVFQAQKQPPESRCMPVFLVPAHVTNDDDCMRFLEKCPVDHLGVGIAVDEPHLTCKQIGKTSGDNLAGLLQHTPFHDEYIPVFLVTATPVVKSEEALTLLLAWGLQGVLTRECDDQVAQGLLDAVTIRPVSGEVDLTPEYAAYEIYTRRPKLDAERDEAIQIRAGHYVPAPDNPALRAGVEAACYLQKMGKSSLAYFDNKKGIQELREFVRAAGLTSWYFQEGDTPQSKRDEEFDRMLRDPNPVVLVTTIALCGTGTNLGGRMNVVMFIGMLQFDQATVLQCIARVARYPNVKATCALVFLPIDSYNTRTQYLWDKKRGQTATFAGTAMVKNAAAEVDEEGEQGRKQEVEDEDLYCILNGLDALAQFGLVLSPKAGCFSVLNISQLQPPTARRKLPSYLESMRRNIASAVHAAAAPPAIAAPPPAELPVRPSTPAELPAPPARSPTPPTPPPPSPARPLRTEFFSEGESDGAISKCRDWLSRHRGDGAAREREPDERPFGDDLDLDGMEY